MQSVSVETIGEFKPEYMGYAARRHEMVKAIGVTSDVDFKDFRSPLRLFAAYLLKL